MHTHDHAHEAAAVAGIRIPDSALARAAREYLLDTSPETLNGHTQRTYVLGAILAQDARTAFDEEIAYVGSLMHDLGLTERHGDERRFEVSGAEAARDFARSQGMSEGDADVVWQSIALHTSVGVNELRAPEVAVVYWGASLDVMAAGHDRVDPATLDEVFARFPRGSFQGDFVELLERAVRRNPAAYVFTWLHGVANCHIEPPLPPLPDAIMASPFANR